MPKALVAAALLLTTVQDSRSELITAAPFVAEGIAPAADGQPLISGVAGRTVLKRRDGRFATWLRPGEFAPMGGLFGMAADRSRNRLWLAEAVDPSLPAAGSYRTALIAADLRTGRVLARYPVEGSRALLGDVLVDRTGAVFASDSRSGNIYVLRPGENTLRLFVATGLRSPQGMVESRDGRALIVSDYGSGLYRIDRASGAVAKLAGELAPRGIDGLFRSGGRLVATHNANRPNRISLIALDAAEASITAVTRCGPDFEDLTLGTIVRGKIAVIARSQWADTNQAGQLGKPGKATWATVPECSEQRR